MTDADTIREALTCDNQDEDGYCEFCTKTEGALAALDALEQELAEAKRWRSGELAARVTELEADRENHVCSSSAWWQGRAETAEAALAEMTGRALKAGSFL